MRLQATGGVRGSNRGAEQVFQKGAGGRGHGFRPETMRGLPWRGNAPAAPLRICFAIAAIDIQRGKGVNVPRGFKVPRDGGNGASGAVRWLLATRAGKWTSPSLSYLWPDPICGQVRKSSGPLLVSRFRRSYHLAAPAFTNVGNKGTLARHDPSVALHLTFL